MILGIGFADPFAFGLLALGLLLVLIFVGVRVVFAAVSGASTATAAVFSRVAIPEMLRYGYNRRMAAGVVAGGDAGDADPALGHHGGGIGRQAGACRVPARDRLGADLRRDHRALGGGVRPDIPLTDVFRRVGLFFIADVLTIAALLAFPEIATWLPDLMG